jgi:formate hydrogenlyase subunit 3/multisubunit Na+/H+ antiporter MnhD subunit
MPLFSLLFFILCLGNSGTPLTLNFIGEFLSLYGAFERLPVLGALACSSIVLSAAFTIFLYNRIAFGGSLSAYFSVSIPDLTKREFVILISLVVPTILFGIYPSPILDGLHYSVSTLIYSFEGVDQLQPLSVAMLLSIPLELNNNSNPPGRAGEVEARTNLRSTVGERFSNKQLAMVRLSPQSRDVIVGLLLSDG